MLTRGALIVVDCTDIEKQFSGKSTKEVIDEYRRLYTDHTALKAHHASMLRSRGDRHMTYCETDVLLCSRHIRPHGPQSATARAL